MLHEAQQLDLTSVYESAIDTIADSGLRKGLRLPACFDCEHCGEHFYPGRSRPNKNNPLKYCSRACKDAHARGVPKGTMPTFTVPTSARPERIRANGLVNMRIRRGALDRPKHCQWCGKKCRPDGHHPDYAQPALVAFLCRKCHMRCHHHEGFEQQVLAKIQTVLVPVSAPPHPAPAAVNRSGVQS
jgi:hypothetical protein